MNNFDDMSMVDLNQSLFQMVKDLSKTVKVDDEPKKMYLAGPWFDERANAFYNTVQGIERSVPHNYDVYYPRDAANIDPDMAFLENVKHVKNADVIVALVARKDVGTAWEIGMAYALGKQIVLLGYDNTTFQSKTNLMLAKTGKAMTLDQWADFLLGNTVFYYDFGNNWEGIE